MIEENPVVMLCGVMWHVVESGRASTVALCGRVLRDCRAHSRLKTVGRGNVCLGCLRAAGLDVGDET
ncbi:protein of unknown function [Candidatus Promineifilum breve]|uniref:Uncharacterized protein n=1 Tax=Candidatus Promineifilum breve TaxID=1806508 RepID=A0A160T1G9_9CHLR|nr:protein of unknown function [Candidatus Promineifilum breve]